MTRRTRKAREKSVILWPAGEKKRWNIPKFCYLERPWNRCPLSAAIFFSTLHTQRKEKRNHPPPTFPVFLEFSASFPVLEHAASIPRLLERTENFGTLSMCIQLKRRVSTNFGTTKPISLIEVTAACSSHIHSNSFPWENEWIDKWWAYWQSERETNRPRWIIGSWPDLLVSAHEVQQPQNAKTILFNFHWIF